VPLVATDDSCDADRLAIDAVPLVATDDSCEADRLAIDAVPLVATDDSCEADRLPLDRSGYRCAGLSATFGIPLVPARAFCSSRLPSSIKRLLSSVAGLDACLRDAMRTLWPRSRRSNRSGESVLVVIDREGA
jgi:hypothetical protein